jgi:transposase
MRRQASAYAGERFKRGHDQPSTNHIMTKPPSTPLSGIKTSLGIDVSKAHLDVCLLTEQPDWHRPLRRKIPNNSAGVKELASLLAQYVAEPVPVVMESTGPYGELSAHLLHEAGHRVSVANAWRVKQYALSRGRHNKTDKVDAEIIARYGLTQELEQWQPLPPAQAALRALLRRREEVAALLQAERNRRDVTLDKRVGKSLDRTIKALGKEMDALEVAMMEYLKTHPDLAADCERLVAVPGIGLKSAMWLVAELPRTLKSSRSAAAWVGVVPRISQSGTLRDPSHISPGGNRCLKKALFLPAVVARRSNPRFKAFADRLAEQGKSKMAIIIAVLHKMIRTAFAILKNQSTYDSSHVSVIH